MAVTHCVDGVLAFSVALVKEAASQTMSSGERTGVKRVAEVHHLVDCEEGLVASLVPLSQFLFEILNSP